MNSELEVGLDQAGIDVQLCQIAVISCWCLAVHWKMLC